MERSHFHSINISMRTGVALRNMYYYIGLSRIKLTE